MREKILEGAKIAILVESEFIALELERYRKRFSELGAEVHFLSRLWGSEQLTFISDVTEIGQVPAQLTVTEEVITADVSDYAAVLMSANYTSVRLSYFDAPAGCEDDWPRFAKEAPAVQFFASAMEDRSIVKGALCHGLLILGPRPDLLKGRAVTCHKVVLAHVCNAGGIFRFSKTGVVVDDDLVTGYAINDLDPYIDEIIKAVICKRTGGNASSS